MSREELVDQLVRQVVRESDHITGIKPPSRARGGQLVTDAATIADVRSRPLFYDYVGSGAGRGPYVELEDGSVKLDFINGIGVHLFGHAHPDVMRASVRGALGDVVQQGNLQPNQEYVEFGRRVRDIAGRNSRLRHAWISTCGTMANENALKITRQKRGGAPLIVTFENAFAGRSTMMAEITDNSAYKMNLPDYREVLRLPFYSANGPNRAHEKLAALIEAHGEKIGCFVFEPMLGEGGYRAANREFFLPLLELCRAHGIPVWADEIQTFARTGNFFCFETYGIGEYIDVCTLAKTAQNGVTLFTADMKPDAGLLGGTFAGSGPSLAAGAEILRLLDEGGYMGAGGIIERLHQKFVAMLNDLNETSCRGQLRDAGGLGLMVAVTPFDGSKAKQTALLKRLFAEGLICFGCGHDPYRIRFLLPAITTEAHISVAREILERSIRAID